MSPKRGGNMIYTVTFNPAIDYIAEVDSINEEKINRALSEKVLAGGKGINVSVVLKNLGIESIVLGFIAGFTGTEIKRQVENHGINTDFVYLNNKFSRINVKLSSKIAGVVSKETAINGEGPKISDKDIGELMEKIDKLKEGDFLVLAGSVSKKMKDDIYEKICVRIQEKKVKIVADATGKLLVNVLKHKPFLIKPNKEEVEEIFQDEIKTTEEIIMYAKKLQEMGAENVLISLGGEGAVLVTKEKNVLYSKAPKGIVVNSVGSGDSMVAGFLAGLLTYDDYEKAFKMGIAAGSASTFSEKLATKDEILYQFSKL